MNNPCEMFDDQREITSIGLAPDNSCHIYVGEFGVTAIRVYREPGEMSYVPYFAVYRGDTIDVRFNGKYVSSVSYSQPASDHF